MTDDVIQVYSQYGGSTAIEALARFLALSRAGDYVTLLAYLTENGATERALRSIRLRLRDRFRLATTLGYGPRYLHSTGQLHKGGSDTSLFLETTLMMRKM